MIVKWGFIFAVLANILAIFSDFQSYFSNFGESFITISVVGFGAGVVVRKWIFRTFWQ